MKLSDKLNEYQLNELNYFCYRYKKEYKKIMDSRMFRVWKKARCIMGKPYEELSDEKLAEEFHKLCENNNEKKDSKANGNASSKKAREFYDNVDSLIASIPVSNGSRFYERYDVKIGIVCDTFFYDSISSAASFQYVTPSNWREKIEEGFDAFFFVTPWRGLDESWKGITGTLPVERNPIKQEAYALLRECKKRKIPTVFYSKEDPPNYCVFLDYAKECDYIFTTAEECVPYYKEDCGKKDVEALCFGVNPQYHNPIGMRSLNKRSDGIMFSGSWMTKYPERCKDACAMLDGVLDANYNLYLIDRNYDLHDERYMFPKKYQPYVLPSLPHDKLQKAHKLFDWAINMNSVKDSQTMFANRAYEMLANGVLLLSNYSVGINSLLPTIFLVHEDSEVPGIMNSLSAEEKYALQMMGVRQTMTGNTCFDRVATILNKIGILVKQPTRKVLVITDAETKAMRTQFNEQTYPDKTLMKESDVSESILKQYDVVTWFHSKAKYDRFYLEDMMNGFKYTACDYVTKDSYYENGVLHKGIEHDYVDHMHSKYQTAFWVSSFSPKDLLTIDDETSIKNGYAIDHLQFDKCSPKHYGVAKKKYAISVVIPTYNNGMHLYGKCFMSLRRSSIFDQMEILIVDDGSTDPRTIAIEKTLCDEYENVTLFSFADGGSGSASRPRNKGVSLATAPYIMFIDPDDEAICDGYAKLLDAAIEKDLDVAIGNMYKCDLRLLYSNAYHLVLHSTRETFFKDGFKDELVTSKFMAPQTMLMRRRFILDHQIKQVEGAIGEDTLFAWQVLYSAKKLEFLDVPIHIYYSKTSNSVTNDIGTSFFKKQALIQQPKAKWLIDHQLMSAYMDKRFEYYTIEWLFKKLSQISTANYKECVSITKNMLDYYLPYYHGNDETIQTFVNLCEQSRWSDVIKFLKKINNSQIEYEMRKNAAMSSTRSRRHMTVLYEMNETSITLTSCEPQTDKTRYTWVVLVNTNKYVKAYQTPTSTENTFTFDYATLEPGTYKVRSFILEGTEKHSEDVLFVRVDEGHKVYIDLKLSIAKKIQD